jgi:hypothetical protein
MLYPLTTSESYFGNRYDTGTIGGIIAMEDWLATFGTFELNLPTGLGAGNYFLPTNRKSLVVSHPNPFPGALRRHDFI